MHILNAPIGKLKECLFVVGAVQNGSGKKGPGKKGASD